MSDRSRMAPHCRIRWEGLRKERCSASSSRFAFGDSGRDVAFGAVCLTVATGRDWSAVKAAQRVSPAKP